MFKGIGNIASLMKTAQQLGSKVAAVKEDLKSQRVTGAAGGGMVEVQANGLGDVLSVKIDPSLFDSGDREMVEDLIPAAVNQAREKANQLHTEAMQAVGAGLSLPGLDEALAQLSDNNT